MNQSSDSEFVEKLKLDFNINVNLSDVVFSKTSIEPYNNNENKNSPFGEKQCALYETDFTVFNINFCMKILTFHYDCSNEILKLDVNVQEKWLENEMVPCRKFLQRNRNLNLTFTVLTEFAKFVEARRLICEIVFLKEPMVVLQKDPEGGIKIRCLNFGAHWKIEWNLKDFSVLDVIHFYYANFGDNGEGIKEKMRQISQPALDFHTKLKMWKSVMTYLRHYSKSRAVELRNEYQPKTSTNEVLVISDTEDEINVDEVSSSSSLSSNGGTKRRRIENNLLVGNSFVTYTIPD